MSSLKNEKELIQAIVLSIRKLQRLVDIGMVSGIYKDSVLSSAKKDIAYSNEIAAKVEQL